MIKELSLCANIPVVPHGPAKVATNLILGLCSLGVNVNLNSVSRYNGILDVNSPLWASFPRQTLVGPILFFPHDAEPTLWTKYDNFVFASQWYLEYVSSVIKNASPNLFVWPAGIDTDRFNDLGSAPTRDCFIYFKRQDQKVLKQIEGKLKELKLSYSILMYGEYSEEELMVLCRTSRFCILAHESETQGIAYMEILSTGIPCFALIPEHFPKEKCLPYFTETCGAWAYSLDGPEFGDFLSNLDDYRPREYIVEEHNLKRAALAYLDLIERCHSKSSSI